MTARRAKKTVAVVLLLLFWPQWALAQSAARAGVVTTLAGQATVTRAAQPQQSLPLRFKDEVFVRDTIRTQERSVVRMLLGGKALVTVRELSVFTITEEEGRSRVDLEAGKLALSVARQRMRPGEVIEIRTPNAVAGVRGTVVIAEIVRSIAQLGLGIPGLTTNFYVLRGSLDVAPRGVPGGLPITVGPLQALSITGNTPGQVRGIPPGQLAQILAGLKSGPQHQDTPEDTKKQVSSREHAKATALAALIAPDPSAPATQQQQQKQQKEDEQLVDASTPATSPTDAIITTEETTPTSPSTPITQEVVAQAGPVIPNPVVITTPQTLAATDTLLTFQVGTAIQQQPDTLVTVSGPTGTITQSPSGDLILSPAGADSTIIGTLLEVSNSPNLTAGTSVLHVGGTLTSSTDLIVTDPTFVTAPNLVKIDLGGNLTVAGSLLIDTGGTYTISGDVVTVFGCLETTGSAPAVSLNGTTMDSGTDFGSTHFFRVSGGGATAAMGGSLLSADFTSGGSFTQKGSAILEVSDSGTLTGTSTEPFMSVTGGTLTLGSGVTGVLIETGSTATIAGNLFTASGTTLDVSGSGRPFLEVSGGSSLTAGGGLDLSNTTLNLGTQPLVTLLNASTLTFSGAAPALKLTNATLIADQIIFADGTGNSFHVTGTAIDLTDSTLTLRDPGETDSGSDTNTFTLAVNEPLVRLTSSTLTTTGLDLGGVTLGDNAAAVPPTEPGVALVATGTTGSPTTINIKGNLFELEAGTFTATDPLVQLDHTTVNQTVTTKPLILVDFSGKTAAMAGPLLHATDATITASGPFVHFTKGDLTSTTTDHFITIDPSTVTSAGSFALFDGGFDLTLHGKLLGVAGSILSSGSGFSFISVIDGARVTTMGTSAPLVYLSNTILAAGSESAGGQFFNVRDAGSTVELSGSLLVADGSTITTGANLVRIRDGGSLSGTGTDELLLFTGGSFTGGGVLGTFGGGSLLRMFSETGQPGTSLTLAAPYLSSSGGTTFLSKDGPMFNIADGATITAAGDFARFGDGSATSAYSFFSLETNTSFGVSPDITVGSGDPASVTVGGTLISGTNFKFTTQNQGNFLHLKNGVTLTQTGKSPLVALDGTGLGPSDFAIDASGTFLSMTAETGLTPPSLTLGGSLLDATNAKLKNGDPASNTISFIFIADGATLTGPTDPPALLSFDGSSVETSANILTLRRSKFTGSPTSPTSVSPSTLSLSGPLFSATNGSSFATSSLGYGSSCCAGFFVGQGAELTMSSSTSPLIQLTGSIFVAGTNFLSITDGLGEFSSDQVVAPASVSLSGPLLSATDSTISGLGNLVRVTRSSLSSTSPDPLIQFSGSDVSLGGTDPFTSSTTVANLLNMVGSSSTPASLSLQGPLLSSMDSTITTTGVGVQLSSGATLTTTVTNDPLISLSGGSVTTGGHFMHVSGFASGGSLPTSVDLSGPLLSVSGTPIDAYGNLLRIAEGASLSSTTTEPLISFAGGSFTGGPVGSVAGSSLLRMFSQVGQSGASLSLAGPFLVSFGAVFDSPDSNTFNIADGATITSTGAGPFASFMGSSVTAAFNLFQLDTNTSFTVNSVTTVGSGDPVSVSIAGTLIEGIDTLFTTAGNFLRLHNGVSLTQTGSAPLIQLTGSSPGDLAVNAAGNFVGLSASSGFPAPSLTLAGPLVSAQSATITNGDPTANTFSNVFIGDGAELASTGTSALMDFTDSMVDTSGNILTVRRSTAVATPSKVTLGGPLFSASGGTFNTTSLGSVTSACCDGFFISQGAQLTSSAAAPLISLSGSTFTSLDSQSGGDFFGVFDTFSTAPSGELIAPASVSLTNAGGSLLSVTDGSLSTLFALLAVSRSDLTSSGTGPLITFDGITGPTVTLGGFDPIAGATTTGGRLLTLVSSPTAGQADDPFGTRVFPATVSLAGPLLSSTRATITATGELVGVFNGASLSSTTTAPLISLTDTSLTTGTSPFSGGGQLLFVGGLGSTAGTTFATASLWGPVLSASSGTTLDLRGGLLFVSSGGQLDMNGNVEPLFSIDGGTHSIATNSGAAVGRFIGRTSATALDTETDALGTQLTLGTDEPVTNQAGAGLEVTGATVNGAQKAVILDSALIEATAPLLALRPSGSTQSAFTTALDAINLQNRAKLTSVGPIFTLDNSTLTITSGALVNLTGGSLLKVTGDLISLTNGSTLSLLNGPVLSLTDGTAGSVVNISGALIVFGTSSGNTVNVTNSLCAAGCSTIGGLKVSLQGGASASQVSVTSPLKNQGTNTVSVSASAAVISVNGTKSKVTISGN